MFWSRFLPQHQCLGVSFTRPYPTTQICLLSLVLLLWLCLQTLLEVWQTVWQSGGLLGPTSDLVDESDTWAISAIGARGWQVVIPRFDLKSIGGKEKYAF